MAFLPDPEITETEADHPLASLLDALHPAVASFKSFVVSNNLEKTGPLLLVAAGFLMRTFLSYMFGDSAFLFTLLLGGAAYYVAVDAREEREGSLGSLGEEARSLGEGVRSARDAKKALRRPPPKKAVLTHDPEEVKRRRNPELYSHMDEVDGKVVKNRHIGRKKVLYAGRRKGGGGTLTEEAAGEPGPGPASGKEERRKSKKE
jgi:hypothetical protein